jgi:hypothetical protein
MSSVRMSRIAIPGNCRMSAEFVLTLPFCSGARVRSAVFRTIRRSTVCPSCPRR